MVVGCRLLAFWKRESCRSRAQKRAHASSFSDRSWEVTAFEKKLAGTCPLAKHVLQVGHTLPQTGTRRSNGECGDHGGVNQSDQNTPEG